jgi:hypothetical protein
VISVVSKCLKYSAGVAHSHRNPPVTHAQALLPYPQRLRVSLGVNMLSVPAHGMLVRGAHPPTPPISGVVPAPLAFLHDCTWSASRQYLRMRTQCHAPLIRPLRRPHTPQRYGCAHVFERNFHGRSVYERLTHRASLCPFCCLLRVYTLPSPPKRLSSVCVIWAFPRVTSCLSVHASAFHILAILHTQ